MDERTEPLNESCFPVAQKGENKPFRQPEVTTRWVIGTLSYIDTDTGLWYHAVFSGEAEDGPGNPPGGEDFRDVSMRVKIGTNSRWIDLGTTDGRPYSGT